MTVAKKYMKAAGYPSGKYTGSHDGRRSSAATPTRARRRCRSSSRASRALGFKTTIKAVPQQTMYSKFCGYVKAHVNVCPTAGWIEDFPDPYAALFVPFSGHAIVPINNSNWAVLNDPKVNDAIDHAATIKDQSARLAAFAQADKMIVDSARRRSPRCGPTTPWFEGSKIHGVLDPWNDDWNLSFTSPSTS